MGVAKAFFILAPIATALIAAAVASAQPSLEEAVRAELNAVRANPPAYAEKLRLYRTYIHGHVANLPGDPVGHIVQEGTAPVDEAIAFLLRQPPLPPLLDSPILAVAAQRYAAEQGPTGALGHVGADGSAPWDRVARAGGGRMVAEVISYGPADAEAVVRGLIVDDGVPSRGHRAILFDRQYRFIGVGCGPHAEYHHMCVADMSGSIDAHWTP